TARATPAPMDPQGTDTDRDGDRVDHDRCPDDPETYNGFEDDDGCPDRAPADRAHCVWTHVAAIIDRITFQPASAQVTPSSDPVLDAIASTLAGNPSIDRVGVVGARDASEH